CTIWKRNGSEVAFASGSPQDESAVAELRDLRNRGRSRCSFVSAPVLFESNLDNGAEDFQGLRDLTLKDIVQRPEEVSGVVEHLFRHEAGKMVATVTKIFGIEHLTLAEDVVQETLARALQTWPFYGVPKNPSAWIMRAARNLALDVVRRKKVFQNKQAEIIRLMDCEPAGADEAIFSEEEIRDDRLRLMFVCCHSAISDDAQVALALKTLCGFGVMEISRAFLTNDAAIA